MPSISSEPAKNLIKNSMLLLVSIIVAVFLCEALLRIYETGFLESGYLLELPSGIVGTGTLSMRLKIISKDMTSYCESGQLEINIE